jgi:Zn-dependent peptidase ImmA (M78 family)
VRVAENAGAVVVKFPAIAREIDALSINRPRPLIVRTSEKEKPTRLRFDIAHEIAHLVMHHGPTPLEHDADARREAEADRFASAFLRPANVNRMGSPLASAEPAHDLAGVSNRNFCGS